MNNFRILFGIKDSQIKRNCILLPFLNKEILKVFPIDKLIRGKLYGCANKKDFTVIHTGIGAGLLGDAVLYLKDTACINIILFGCCGAAYRKQGLNIADLITSSKCYAMESFSSLLLNKNAKPAIFYPDKVMLEAFMRKNHNNVRPSVCMTVSSLKLEDQRQELFDNLGVEALDMECSALFSAASYIGRKAIGLFYVSDIIKYKPFYKGLGQEDKNNISLSIHKAVNIICEFLKENSGG